MLCVRANHHGLHDRMEDTFHLEWAEDFDDCPHDYADTVGKDHGRTKIRSDWTTGDPAYLAHIDPDLDWCGLASLVWVKSEHHCGDQVTTDTRCFISNLPPKAQLLLQAEHQH